jgi:serine/threonine-protein kinase
LVPTDWRKQAADANQGEHRFVSPEGDAWLALSGRPAEEQSPDEYLRSFAFVDGEDVTYLRRERDWLVSFGFKDDKHERKFYRKVILSCDGHRWRHLTVEYPVTTRSPVEQLIDDLSEVMDFTKNAGCEAAPSASIPACRSSKVDLGMRLALGGEVPRDVKLFNFPGEAYACDARLANLRYVVAEDQVVIVDPADYTIVDAISP